MDATGDELLTRVGAMVGTMAYMSPEQARGKELDTRTDIFSFGAVLYEMGTGVQPFRGDSPADIFDSLLNRAPEGPVKLNPALPASLEIIIDKALRKDPNLRYQSAAELRADLQQLKRDTESGRTPAVNLRNRFAVVCARDGSPSAALCWLRLSLSFLGFCTPIVGMHCNPQTLSCWRTSEIQRAMQSSTTHSNRAWRPISSNRLF